MQFSLESHPRNGNSRKKTHLKKNSGPAEAIALLADNGKDVSRFFTNTGQMRKSIQRVKS
jgi:hypothetical protein